MCSCRHDCWWFIDLLSLGDWKSEIRALCSQDWEWINQLITHRTYYSAWRSQSQWFVFTFEIWIHASRYSRRRRRRWCGRGKVSVWLAVEMREDLMRASYSTIKTQQPTLLHLHFCKIKKCSIYLLYLLYRYSCKLTGSLQVLLSSSNGGPGRTSGWLKNFLTSHACLPACPPVCLSGDKTHHDAELHASRGLVNQLF